MKLLQPAARLPVTLWLLVAYGCFVVYGSLVPLEFKPVPLDVAWERFQHIPFLKLGLESRADWVANGVLYAPLAFLVARVGQGLGLLALLAAGLSALVCGGLAVAVEFTQLYFPGRTVSQNDILAECIGSVLGAFAVMALGPWVDRLAQAWRAGGVRLLPRLLELYALVYVLLCFFPYDLLLSAAEVQGKWQSGGWAWLLAVQDRGLFLTGLQWLVEVALAVPIGAMRLFQHEGRARVGRALLLGALLGLFIELGQFFVASGISQGVSVLSRMLGVLAGAALLPWARHVGWPGVRALAAAWVPWLWLPYVLTLVAVSGAFRLPLQGAAQAWASWHSTRLLPFYYHYFTTEALAMFSLGSVALMYLPVAVLVWARRGSLAVALGLAGLLSLLIETGKLFLQGAHADPTNVIVALGVTLLTTILLRLVQAETIPASSGAPDAPGSLASAEGRQSSSGALLLVLPVAAVWALLFPVFVWPLLLLLIACAALVWRWPVLALGLIPAALPVLDWAPWSGRFFWDEFDLLQAVCLAVALHRAPSLSAAASGEGSRWVKLAFLGLGLSLALSSLRALANISGLDANSFSSYYSSFNALRIVKGGLWAMAFAGLWQRLQPQGEQRARVFGAGLMAGLALTVLFVLFERQVFAGLLDFSADFRVTGPFSAMHKGGAYIECFLAVASAFAMSTVLRPGPVGLRATALLLLAGTGYAMLVTYSRNGYAALAVVLLVSLAVQIPAWLRERGGNGRWMQAAFVALMLLVVAGVALPIAGGSYARQRLAKSGADLGVRQAHWEDGLQLRDGSVRTTLLGVGVGRFPERHFWLSREAQRAASYRLVHEGDVRFLRLGQGATLYIEQIVPRPEVGRLQLSYQWRGAAGQAAPALALCEKWTLTSLRCAAAVAQPVAPAAALAASAASAGSAPALNAPPLARPAPAPGAWQHAELTLDATPLLARPAPWRAPLKLSVFTPALGSVDITDIQLQSALGEKLLANGDFSQGMDRWFFATDVDPPWHLHSLPVAVLFDQGWLGVLVWTLLAAVALSRGAGLLWRCAAQVPAALPAVLGFAVSGTLNTLIDAPRFLWLLLVLLWLAAARASARVSARETAADAARDASRAPAPALAPTAPPPGGVIGPDRA